MRSPWKDRLHFLDVADAAARVCGHEETRKSAARETAWARKGPHPVSRVRSRATKEALEQEGHAAASHTALSKHAHAVARRRGPKARSASAKKAARTRARRRA